MPFRQVRNQRRPTPTAGPAQSRCSAKASRTCKSWSKKSADPRTRTPWSRDRVYWTREAGSQRGQAEAVRRDLGTGSRQALAGICRRDRLRLLLGNPPKSISDPVRGGIGRLDTADSTRDAIGSSLPGCSSHAPGRLIVWRAKFTRGIETLSGDWKPDLPQNRRRRSRAPDVRARIDSLCSHRRDAGFGSEAKLQPISWGQFLRRCDRTLGSG